MKYGILLWPHANSRYFEAVGPLARGEANLLLARAGLRPNASIDAVKGVDFLTFETDDPLDDRQISLLRRHSMIYLLVLMEDDGRMTPLSGRADAYLGHDLGGILKYKGKTNDAFTRYLLNLALLSGDYADRFDEALSVLDPMCGRLTTLFEAVNRGYDASGADVDGKEISEGMKFFRKYLEFHHVKHAFTENSMTLPGKKHARVRRYQFAADADAFKAGDRRTLSVTELDAEGCARAFGAGKFHMAVFDMPYGVQHGPGGREPFDALLSRVLPGVHAALRRGGAVAFSFNAHTLPAKTARALLAQAGFEVMEGDGYDGMAHWVEQAITRDVAVGRK